MVIRHSCGLRPRPGYEAGAPWEKKDPETTRKGKTKKGIKSRGGSKISKKTTCVYRKEKNTKQGKKGEEIKSTVDVDYRNAVDHGKRWYVEVAQKKS